MKNKKSLPSIIHIRYIFPALADLVTIILLFIPSYRFMINFELEPKQSIFDLIQNSWNGSRAYLFSSSAQTTPEGTMLYKTIFIILIALTLLFLIGVFINIFSMIVSYRELIYPEYNKKLKNIYLAFIPNRIVLCFFRLTLIPIFFLPEIVALCYRKLLFQSVSVKYPILNLAIIAGAFFLITVILTAISKKYEVKAGKNIFFKKSAFSDTADDIGDESKQVHTEKVYNINQNNSEVAEKIRKLLGEDHEEK